MSVRGRGSVVPLIFTVASFALGCAAAGGRRSGPSSEAVVAAPGAVAAGSRTVVYVGLAGGAVATFHLDLATGTLGRRGSVDVGRSPTSLARSVERETLVAVDQATGLAVALAIDAKTGALTLVGRMAAGGASPSGAVVDGTGKYLLAALPGSGSVSVLAIKPDGTLGAIGTFPAGAGAAAVALHPANQVAFVANTRANTISQFTFNTGTGILTTKAGPPLELPAGSGPARFACHPSGRWVYVLEETGDAISVHVFDEDLKALSALSAQIVSTLPERFSRAKSRPSDLALGRAGRFLYATNRGHDSVVTFAVGPDGTLKLVGHEPSGGHAAGALAVDPSGAYLVVANQASKNLVVFRLDPTTGLPGAPRTVSLTAAPLAIAIAALQSI
jgi:6-phosphogluconolactonase